MVSALTKKTMEWFLRVFKLVFRTYDPIIAFYKGLKSHLTQHTPARTMATEPTMRNTPKNTREKRNYCLKSAKLKLIYHQISIAKSVHNTPIKEWSSDGYGAIKGALWTAEMMEACVVGLVVGEEVVRTLVWVLSGVAVVADDSVLCRLLGQESPSVTFTGAGEGAEEHKKQKKMSDFINRVGVEAWKQRHIF